jgi:hypothetical protein
MNTYKSFAVTVTGVSHTKTGKGCQDSSDKYEDSGVCIAAVSDGHGDDNCFRSNKGADFAVKSAIEGIFRFVKYHKPKFSFGPIGKKHIHVKNDFDKPVNDVVKHIIAEWQKKVEEDHSVNPITPD